MENDVAASRTVEVCLTAIETTMTATLRLSVMSGRSIAAPELKTGRPPSPATSAAGHYVTTGIATDLMVASKQAVRAMIRYLVEARGLTRDEAYVLCSVAVDLRISEVVDAPNWIVSAFLPLAIFG